MPCYATHSQKTHRQDEDSDDEDEDEVRKKEEEAAAAAGKSFVMSNSLGGSLRILITTQHKWKGFSRQPSQYA